MQRGNLVIYDLEGMIISQTGEMQSDSPDAILPHNYPVGVPFIEIPYGNMDYANRRLTKIDVSKTPNEPIFEPHPQTAPTQPEQTTQPSEQSQEV